MGRKFDIPLFYRSSLITALKGQRNSEDHRKQDLSPSLLDLGPVRFKLARHFGFCFGVENAIEIAYRAVHENPDRRVFLLSEMIHNKHVNDELASRGVRFILTTEGQQIIPFSELKADDIVIVPAFGTTLELCAKLEALGIDLRRYNATCPFVEKVWKRSAQLGERGYTVIIHGKHKHEETRATFSHAVVSAPAVIIRDIKEALVLAKYIRREIDWRSFSEDFAGRYSDSFAPERHLDRIGVVNQTTMLATETQEISDLLRSAIKQHFGEENLPYHFADTRDTLCYATTENQNAIHGLVRSGGDLAIVVGGYNSSNTSHLVELCEERVPTYYIKDAGEIIDAETIRHLLWRSGEVKVTKEWLPRLERPIEILLTAGASCPDALVNQVVAKIAGFFQSAETLEDIERSFAAVQGEA
ncbi:MAG: 4-hydroxy-3-methylbut-2-enyl diphosphate reductase [Deltaproteobacteria bacterium]|nr:4-hydroxy-3-methylbut-2-enyl diphosphate reductase [Deltaproteobacteria bacterium]